MTAILCVAFTLLAVAAVLVAPMPLTWMCLGGTIAGTLIGAGQVWCSRGVLPWKL